MVLTITNAKLRHIVVMTPENNMKTISYNLILLISCVTFNILALYPSTTQAYNSEFALPKYPGQPVTKKDSWRPTRANIEWKESPQVFINEGTPHNPRRRDFSISLLPPTLIDDSSLGHPTKVALKDGAPPTDFDITLLFSEEQHINSNNDIALRSTNCSVHPMGMRTRPDFKRVEYADWRISGFSFYNEPCHLYINAPLGTSVGDVRLGLRGAGAPAGIILVNDKLTKKVGEGRVRGEIHIQLMTNERGGYNGLISAPYSHSYHVEVPLPDIQATQRSIRMTPVNKNGVHDGHLRMAGRAPLFIRSYYPFTVRARCPTERRGQCIITSTNVPSSGLILAASVGFQGRDAQVCMSSASECHDAVFAPTGLQGESGTLHLTTRFDSRQASLPLSGTKLSTPITLIVESEID